MTPDLDDIDVLKPGTEAHNHGLKAAQHLLDALWETNLADDGWMDRQASDRPYGQIHDALELVLVRLYGVTLGKELLEACIDNNESLAYNIGRLVITRVKAEQVLEAVKTQCRAYLDDSGEGPQLVEGGSQFGSGRSQWHITWEDGPFEWAYRFPHGGVDEELTNLAGDAGAAGVARTPEVQLPPGLWAEAITSFQVAIYTR